MALPSQKRTRKYKKNRAVQYRLKKRQIQACPQCGSPVVPHRVCESCGRYRGREVAS